MAHLRDALRHEADTYITAAVEVDFTACMCIAATHALAGGKRVRAVCALALAGSDAAHRAHAAVVPEYLHAASLILDDIMDGDSVRRGAPALHRVFGVARAQCVATLLTLAAARRLDARGTVLTRALGCLQRMCEAQWYDIAGRVAPEKTSALFELTWSVAHCGSLGNAALDSMDEIARAGAEFGELFQIADDAADVASDRARGSPNYVISVGRVAAHARAIELAHATVRTVARVAPDAREVIESYVAELVHQCR